MDLIEKGALFSADGKHRFKLWRIWDHRKPAVLFVMLNPATATADEDDNTIRKCTAMARQWGTYGGFYVGNLFSQRTPYPKDLRWMNLKDPKALGANDAALRELTQRCRDAVVAWGNDGHGYNWRVISVLQKLEKPKAIQLTAQGAPWHPARLARFPAWRELVAYNHPV